MTAHTQVVLPLIRDRHGAYIADELWKIAYVSLSLNLRSHFIGWKNFNISSDLSTVNHPLRNYLTEGNYV